METTTAATTARVVAAVTQAGMTRLELSEESGIAYTTLGRKLRGQSSWTVEDIDIVARVLKVEPASLVQFRAVA